MEESESLLPHSGEDEQLSEIGAKMDGTTLGKIRAYWLGSVVCMGGFLFGYDSGM